MHSLKVPLFACLLVLTGCMHVERPAIPEALAPSKDTAYARTDFHKDYETYKGDISRGDYVSATALRDQMINRIEIDVEQDYREFEGKLFTNRAAAQTGSDMVELGLSAATSVVGGEDVKELLAASLTGFKGTRISVDKNYFREKTTEALISQMQAYRDTVRNRITQKLAEMDAQKYPFEESWRDLVEFFYAGTLPAALQQLANVSGQAATEAKAASKEIDIRRANTAEEKKAAVRIRQKYDALASAINGNDEAAKADALETAKQALSALGQEKQMTANPKPEEVLSLLRAQMKHALQNPEEIAPLDKLLTPPQQ